MLQRHRIVRSALIAATLSVAAMTHAQVQFGQIDTFEDGSTQGWGAGANDPNPPSNQLGGPAGVGDHYLQSVSTGVGTAGSKQIMFNGAQWAGNFLSAHVTRLTADMENLGDTPLNMRVALEGQTDYVSANPVLIPPHTSWQRVTFDLSSASMIDTLIPFGDMTPLSTVLSQVFEVRILSKAQLNAADPGDNTKGETIASTLGMDNLRGLTLPGDANFDNSVTTADFTILATHFNQTGASWGNGDFNFDGVVNALDFNILATNFGQSITIDPPTGSVVPEPAMALMLFAALLMKRV
jgi:hypothetical protein